MTVLFEDQTQGISVVGVDVPDGKVRCAQHSPDHYMLCVDQDGKSLILPMSREALEVLVSGIQNRFLG